MQTDGNLVMTRASAEIVTVLWHADTHGNEGAVLRVRDDGFVQIVSTRGSVRWSIGSPPTRPIPATRPIPDAREFEANEVLVPGQHVESPDGLQRLSYEEDSNLVLSARRSGDDPWTVRWQSDTIGLGDVLTMQADGNLVMSEGGTLTPVWHTGTHGNEGASLRVENGNMLTIRSAKDVVLWSRSSVLPSPPPVVAYNALDSGGSLDPGDAIVSPNGCQMLTLQHDGNLILYRLRNNWTDAEQPPTSWVPLWSSQTAYSRSHDLLIRSEALTMQEDGNLVLTQNLPGEPTPISVVWHAGTSYTPPPKVKPADPTHTAFLAVQDDGRAVIRTTEGAELWSVGLDVGSSLWSLDHTVGASNVVYQAAGGG